MGTDDNGYRGCLLAIVFVLWIRIAHRDACATASPARGARRVATQEEAVDMYSNASYAGSANAVRITISARPGTSIETCLAPPSSAQRSAVVTTAFASASGAIASGPT